MGDSPRATADAAASSAAAATSPATAASSPSAYGKGQDADAAMAVPRGAQPRATQKFAPGVRVSANTVKNWGLSFAKTWHVLDDAVSNINTGRLIGVISKNCAEKGFVRVLWEDSSCTTTTAHPTRHSASLLTAVCAPQIPPPISGGRC